MALENDKKQDMATQTCECKDHGKWWMSHVGDQITSFITDITVETPPPKCWYDELTKGQLCALLANTIDISRAHADILELSYRDLENKYMKLIKTHN